MTKHTFYKIPIILEILIRPFSNILIFRILTTTNINDIFFYKRQRPAFNEKHINTTCVIGDIFDFI